MLDKESNIQEESREVATFETFEVVGDDIYIQVLFKNIIAKISPESNKVELLKSDKKYRFKHCAAEGGKIYFADNAGEALVVYDIKSETSKEYPLDSHEKEDNNIVTVECHGGCVFIVSQYKGIIYIFDMANETIKRDLVLYKLIDKKYGGMIERIRCWKVDNYLYIRIEAIKGCTFFRYDLLEKCLEDIAENAFPDEMIDAYYYGDKWYILQDEFNLIIWDIKNNSIKRICMSDLYHLLDTNRKKCFINFLVVTKKNIWLLPTAFGEEIYIYDILKDSVSKYSKYPENFCYANLEMWSKYSEIKKRGDYVYVAARLSNYYLIINEETGVGIWKPTYIEDDVYFQYLLINEKIIYEQENSLKRFLNYLQYGSQNVMQSGNAGAEVWEKLK